MSEYLRRSSSFDQLIDVRGALPGIDSFEADLMHNIVDTKQSHNAQEIASRVHFFDPQHFEGPGYFDDVESINQYMTDNNQAALAFTNPAEVAFDPKTRQRTIVRYDELIEDYVPDGQLLTEQSAPFTGDTVRHCRGLAVLCDSVQKIGIELHPSDAILLCDQNSSIHLEDELSSERLKYGILSEGLRNNATNSLFVTRRVARHLIDQVVSQEDTRRHHVA